MPLSLNKVEKLLHANKLLPTAFYILDGKCIFIRVFSIDTGYTFLIHIGSEYELLLANDGRGVDRLNLCPVEEENVASTVEKYGSMPGEAEIKEQYDIDFQKDIKGSELEANLENNYKKKIFLNDLERNTKYKIKNCIRQLKRMSLSFDEIRYTLCMAEDQVFVYNKMVTNHSDRHSDRNSAMRPYIIKEQNTNKNRLLFIVVTLEFFYEEKMDIVSDIITIKKSLYNILDKTAKTNLKNLLTLFQKFGETEESLQQFTDTKLTLSMYIKKYENMLESVVQKESEIIDEIYKLQESHERGSVNETTFVHIKKSLDEKRETSIEIKQKILKNLNSTLNKCDNIYLKCDKFEFDNTILIDTIQKNIKEMHEEIEKNI